MELKYKNKTGISKLHSQSVTQYTKVWIFNYFLKKEKKILKRNSDFSCVSQIQIVQKCIGGKEKFILQYHNMCNTDQQEYA